jgi:hypothetical protein
MGEENNERMGAGLGFTTTGRHGGVWLPLARSD